MNRDNLERRKHSTRKNTEGTNRRRKKIKGTGELFVGNREEQRRVFEEKNRGETETKQRKGERKGGRAEIEGNENTEKRTIGQPQLPSPPPLAPAALPSTAAPPSSETEKET
jgi:hypothetical protein